MNHSNKNAFIICSLIFIILIIIQAITKENNEEKLIENKNISIKNRQLNVNFSIAIIHFDSFKIKGNYKDRNINYTIYPLTYSNEKNKVISHLNHRAFIISGAMNSEKISYQQFVEDRLLSFPFNYFDKLDDLKNYDHVFIAPVGLTINEELMDSLYNLLIEEHKQKEEICFSQMFISQEEMNKLKLIDGMKFIPDHSSSIFRQYGGTIFTPHRFDRLVFYTKDIYNLGRYDSILQSYCDIGNLSVLVTSKGNNKYSNYNLL